MATIEAKRSVLTSLELVSTGIYKVNVSDINFYSLYVNGVLSTNKTTAIVIGDAAYSCYLDLENNELQIRIDAADVVAKKNLIVHHIMSFTNDHDLYWNIDPDSPNTRKILYQARMLGRPEFSQSQENNLVGILSTSISDFNFDNTDQWFNSYFTSKNSLRDSKVKIWKCSELPSSRAKFFVGYVAGASGKSQVSITVNDFLRVLDSPMYSFNDSYYDSIASGLGSVSVNQGTIPTCRLYGRSSSYKTIYDVTATAPECESGSMPQAVCTSYNPSLSTSVNRVWATGIIEDMSGYEDSYSISYVTTAMLLGTSYLFIQVTSGMEDFSVGDTFVIVTGGVDTYASVAFVGSGGIYCPQFALTPIVGNVVKLHKISCLAMKVSGVNAVLFYKRDYTVNANVAGQPISITLVNNAEAAIGKVDPIDPANETIGYKMRNVSGLSAYSHGAQIKKILLDVFETGEINSDSFDDADSALDLDLNFQVPFVGEDFITKRDLLQKLLASSFGYLYVNDQFKISYGNYSLPGAENFEDITDIEVDKNSISHNLDYQDVYWRVKFINSQFDEYYEITDEEAYYLHGTTKPFDFNHVCDVVSSVKPITHFVEVASFFSTPKIISTFKLLSYDAKIGDRKNLNSVKAFGDSRGTITSTSEGDIFNTASMAVVEELEGNKYYSNSSGFLIGV